MIAIRRRAILLALVAIFATGAAAIAPADAWADSGKGGGNSGSGGGGDDGGGDDGGDDGADDGGDDNDNDNDNDGDDKDRARDAYAKGESRPLKELLQKVKGSHPGEIVGVRLQRSKGGLVYRVKVIETSGRIVSVRLDARTGAILGAE